MKLVGKSLCLLFAVSSHVAMAEATPYPGVEAGVEDWGWNPGDWGRDISDGLKHARDVVGDEVARLDPVEGVRAYANKQAADYHDQHGNSGSFTDCVVIVAASCAAAAAALGGGVLGAGLGAGGGVAAADLACRSWYP